MEVTILVSILGLALYAVLTVIRRARIARLRSDMASGTGTHGKKVATLHEVLPGGAKKFWLICGNSKVDGLLVRFNGGFYAYANRCRHMETPLDWVQNRFFSEDGRYLYCGTHGATYEPETGKCVEGPCKGLSLFPLPIELVGADVLVKCPEASSLLLEN